MLRFRQKIERVSRLVEIISQITDVFGNAHNFVLAGRFYSKAPEMLSNGVFLS